MANNTKQISVAFINDKSPIIDNISNNLSGTNILFRSESIEDGLSQLSVLAEQPQVCIIDLDFEDSNVLAQLHELKTKYPALKLIAHSDIDTDEAVKALLEVSFDSYLLIGSDTEDLQTAIEGVCNGRKYFSTGISKIAREYFSSKANA